MLLDLLFESKSLESVAGGQGHSPLVAWTQSTQVSHHEGSQPLWEKGKQGSLDLPHRHTPPYDKGQG